MSKKHTYKSNYLAPKGQFKFAFIAGTIAGIFALIVGIPTIAIGVGIFFVIGGLFLLYVAKKSNYIYKHYEEMRQNMLNTSSQPVNQVLSTPDTGYYNPYIQRYYDGIDSIESMWSVMYNMKIVNGEKADLFEKKCKENINLLYQMLDVDKKNGRSGEMPPHVPTYVRLAMLYEKQGRFEDGINICVEAIKVGATSDGSKGKMYGRLARLIKKSGIQVDDDILALSMKAQ